MKEITFGEFIAAKRKRAKYTLRELSEILSLSPTYLCNVERGKRPAPSYEIQVMMACVLGMDDEERFKMFDLAAKTKQRVTVPNDVLIYIQSDEKISLFLRTVAKRRLKGKDLLELISNK